jgi:hypothetical protein
MDEWRFLAERKILEAMKEGAFDDLEGTGKPLASAKIPSKTRRTGWRIDC